MTTVLSHIIAARTGKENVASKALSYILNRSPDARAVVETFIERHTGVRPSVSRVVSQEALGDESRPDLLLLDEQGKLTGVVEAKFWAALTAAQPVAYLRRLEDSPNTALIVLAPMRRLPKLREEFKARCAGLTVVDAGPSCLTVNETCLVFLSWDELLGALGSAVVSDRGCASDVHQLEGLCRRFEAESFIPLTSEDLADVGVPRRMLALAELCDDIIDAAARERLPDSTPLVTIKGLKAAHYSGATGRYGAFSRAGFWFGLSFRQWARRGGSPLWLRFGRDEWGRADLLRSQFMGWTAAQPAKAYTDDEDGAIRIPMPFLPDASRETLIEHAVQWLRAVNDVVDAGSLPLLGPTRAKEVGPTESVEPEGRGA